MPAPTFKVGKKNFPRSYYVIKFKMVASDLEGNESFFELENLNREYMRERSVVNINHAFVPAFYNLVQITQPNVTYDFCESNTPCHQSLPVQPISTRKAR